LFSAVFIAFVTKHALVHSFPAEFPPDTQCTDGGDENGATLQPPNAARVVFLAPRGAAVDVVEIVNDPSGSTAHVRCKYTSRDPSFANVGRNVTRTMSESPPVRVRISPDSNVKSHRARDALRSMSRLKIAAGRAKIKPTPCGHGF
jgi:hypothetical protein